MKQKRVKGILVSAAVVAALGAGGLQVYGPASVQAASSASLQTLPDFAELVQRYGPAVVNVRVTQAVRAAADNPQAPQQPRELEEFLRRFQIPMPRGDAQPARGLGSGFIVSPDGLILTNAHVVRGGGEVIVRLTDKREFKAKVIGTDLQTDVAVLKVEDRKSVV